MTDNNKQQSDKVTKLQSSKKEQKEEKKEPLKIQKEEEKPSQPSEAKEAPKPAKAVKLSNKLGKIIEEIEKLTVIELSDLVKALEDKFGVSGVPVAALGVAPAQAPAGGQGPAGPVSEQTVFNVILAQTGANKIQVIKALRQIKPTLGLQEAKKMTEEVPQEILSQVNKKEAEEAKKKLEEVGATVELK